MNDQNFAVRVNTADDIEPTDQGKSDRVLPGLIQQTPVGGGMVSVGPADEVIIPESLPEEKIPSNVPGGDVATLPTPDDSEDFRTLWNEIQGRFVDEPRSAVQHADTLVSEAIEKITQQFANEHGSLERQWKEGNDASTEDLRQALKQYRSFFNRLVACM